MVVLAISQSFLSIWIHLRFLVHLDQPSIEHRLTHIQRICDLHSNNFLRRSGVRIKRTTSLKCYNIPKSSHTRSLYFTQHHPGGCVTQWASKNGRYKKYLAKFCLVGSLELKFSSNSVILIIRIQSSERSDFLPSNLRVNFFRYHRAVVQMVFQRVLLQLGIQ